MSLLLRLQSSRARLFSHAVKRCFNKKVMIGVPLVAFGALGTLHNTGLQCSDSKNETDDEISAEVLALAKHEPPHIKHPTELGLFRVIFRATSLLIIFTPMLLLTPVLMILPFKCLRHVWGWLMAASAQSAGATFIKLGQWASTRPDLLSEAACLELAKLQSSIRPHSLSKTVAAVEEAFHRPINEIFSEFEAQSVASGSIAQVHYATLVDGRRVAVKVAHPGVAKQMETDLCVMHSVARFLNALPTFCWFALPQSVEQFGEAVTSQLDFRTEADSLDRFRLNFANRKMRVRFPAPIRPFVHQNVLVETYEEGIPMERYLEALRVLSQSPTLKKDPAITHVMGVPKACLLQHEWVASEGMNAFLSMMIEDNFVHGDLHPGNLLVDCSKVDSGVSTKPEIVMLDAGLVSELHKDDFRKFVALFAAIASGDGRLGASLMLHFGPSHNCRQPKLFEEQLGSLLEEAAKHNIFEMEVSKTFLSVMNLLRTHRVMVDPVFATLVSSITVLEGLGRQLQSTTNVIRAAAPLLLRTDIRALFSALWTHARRRSAPAFSAQ